MNNKLKYKSVPQDSFKFENLRRLDSELRPVSTPNYSTRINEICLAAAENEADWVRYKSFYIKAETSTLIIGTSCSILAFLTAIFFLFYDDFYELMQLIVDPLFQHPFLYLMVEILSLILDMSKLLSTKYIWEILKTKIRPDIQDDGTAISDAIHKLKIRCSIRQKVKQIYSMLFYLNFFVFIYFVIFIVVVKYSLAIYLNINYRSFIEIGNSSHFCNSLRFNETSSCLESVKSSVGTFLINFIVFLYITGSVKLIVQTLSILNFKNVLGFYLIEKNSDIDLNLWEEYDKNKNKLFMNDINERIEESQAYIADKFFNLNKKDSNYINEKESRYMNQNMADEIKTIDSEN